MIKNQILSYVDSRIQTVKDHMTVEEENQILKSQI
jgi:hypothetical protein